MSDYLRNNEGDEIEIVRTQHDHPERRDGAHVNGALKLFWRELPIGDWYMFDHKAMHVLRTEFLTAGLGWLKSISTKLEEVTE